jgi:IclR family KDG regulon transcriptional repressor
MSSHSCLRSASRILTSPSAGAPRLLEEAAPLLERLAGHTHERAHLSVLQGAEVLTVLSQSAGRAVEAVGWVGRVTRAYCTSAGQALLMDHDRATLQRLFADVEFSARAHNSPRNLRELEARIAAAQENGVVFCSEEFENGLVAAAAPVRDVTGSIVGELNGSAPKFRVDGNEEALMAAVSEAAVALSVPPARSSTALLGTP